MMVSELHHHRQNTNNSGNNTLSANMDEVLHHNANFSELRGGQ